jgi:SAM-dependent methyltransferase
VNQPRGERVIVNVGCGPLNANDLPGHFADWTKLRVDVDLAVKPDIVADLTDLSPIADGTAHAVWASHCIEHLYEYQVPIALAEFRRVLRADGFVCIIVPDLQTVANYVVADRLHETLYDSPAGPVTPHDIVFGFGAAIASGRPSMAHRCGFTPTMLQRAFARETFGEVLLRRRMAQLELVALARVTPAQDNEERQALLNALGL